MPNKPYHSTVTDMPRKSRLDGILEETALVTDKAILHWSWLKPGHPNLVDQHDWDQTMYFLEGIYQITLNGSEVYDCKPGEVLYIPGGVPHAGKVLSEEPVHVLQVFAPIREDYLHLADAAQRS